jgi:hypothetical protein
MATVTRFSGWGMSSKSIANGSRIASAASSKETLCFARFNAAFGASHSKSPRSTVATGTVLRRGVGRVERTRSEHGGGDETGNGSKEESEDGRG